MKSGIFTFAVLMGWLGFAEPVRAQFVPPVVDRSAEVQVVRWFQAYLNRNPTPQEAAILTNQYLISGNPIYVQSVLLASNEFANRAGWTPQAYMDRLFFVTLGRRATVAEVAQLQPLLLQNGRLWFAQAYLTQLAASGGWGAYNFNRFVAQPVPVPIVVPIIVR